MAFLRVSSGPRGAGECPELPASPRVPTPTQAGTQAAASCHNAAMTGCQGAPGGDRARGGLSRLLGLRGRRRICGWLGFLSPRRARNWIRHGCSNLLTNTFLPRALLPTHRYTWVAPSWVLQTESFSGGSPGDGCQALSSQARAKGKGSSAGREARRSCSGIPWDQVANPTIKHWGPASTFGFTAW